MFAGGTSAQNGVLTVDSNVYYRRVSVTNILSRYSEDLRRARQAVSSVKTEQEAVLLAQTRWWEDLDAVDVAWLQLNQEFLCMPFDTFADSLGVLLDRPVLTHEFADPKSLIAEAIAKYGQEALP